MNPSTASGVATQAALTYWACQSFFWGLNAFGQVYSAAGTLQQPLGRIVLEVTLLNVLALGLSHLLRIFMKRHDWKTLGMPALLPRILGASVLLGLPIAVIMHFLVVAPLWRGTPEDAAGLPAVAQWLLGVDPLLLRTMNWSIVFFLWIVLYFCITSLRDRRSIELRQSELTRALQAAELRLLKSQLNPHFLFNSLNSVRALIADDPAGAQRAVTQLARTLRYTLSADQEELVTLERELEIVADYLELESLRLGDRLRIERTVVPPAEGMRIPVMLLQTVVENAVKHGIAALPQGGVLRIRAGLQGGVLSIEVQNPRPGGDAPGVTQGVGLRNAAERLRLLFGDRATIELDLSHPELALARIRIPQSA